MALALPHSGFLGAVVLAVACWCGGILDNDPAKLVSRSSVGELIEMLKAHGLSKRDLRRLVEKSDYQAAALTLLNQAQQATRGERLQWVFSYGALMLVLLAAVAAFKFAVRSDRQDRDQNDAMERLQRGEPTNEQAIALNRQLRAQFDGTIQQQGKGQLQRQRFLVGEVVRCRDHGCEWAQGIVTEIDPSLKVKVKRYSDADAERWGEVRSIFAPRPRAEREREWGQPLQAEARARAEAAADVMIEGQLVGEQQHGLMGRYALLQDPPVVVNERAVYRAPHGRGGYLYFTQERTWAVALTREDMLRGDAAGYLYSQECDALTPDEAMGPWSAGDGVRGIAEVPNVRVVQCGEERKRAAEAAEARRRESALQQAQAAGDLDLLVESGESGTALRGSGGSGGGGAGSAGRVPEYAGVYTLQPPEAAVHGRAVWRRDGGSSSGSGGTAGFGFLSPPQLWLYYAPACEQWFISDEGDMQAGATRGWMYLQSNAATPHGDEQRWRVSITGRKETSASNFEDAPGAYAACRSAHGPS
jgi:hypothetical protein